MTSTGSQQLYILRKVMFGASRGRDPHMTAKYPITRASVQAGSLSPLPGLIYTLGNGCIVLQVSLVSHRILARELISYTRSQLWLKR